MPRESHRKDVISSLVRDMFGLAPCDRNANNDQLRNAQLVLEDRLGITGIERREELYELLQECWYKLAVPHPNLGYYTNGEKLLVKMEKILGGCGRDVHVNRCCCLGLVSQKNRIIAGEPDGPVPEEAEERG